VKFTEEKLEQAVIDLFEAEGYKHKHIKSLKEKGILKRIGGTRGRWEVKE
jgi:restriction endonuclease Mrr